VNDIDSFALFVGNANAQMPKQKDIVEEIPLRVFEFCKPRNPMDDSDEREPLL